MGNGLGKGDSVSGRSGVVSFESSAVGWFTVAVASFGQTEVEGQLRNADFYAATINRDD